METYCGQMAGWIKMALGMEVGLGAGHIVPIFVPFLLWTNGWMDQDATLYGGRPRPRPHCVRRGPISSTPRKGTATPLFSAHVYCGHGRLFQLLLSL